MTAETMCEIADVFGIRESKMPDDSPATEGLKGKFYREALEFALKYASLRNLTACVDGHYLYDEMLREALIRQFNDKSLGVEIKEYLLLTFIEPVARRMLISAGMPVKSDKFLMPSISRRQAHYLIHRFQSINKLRKQ